MPEVTCFATHGSFGVVDLGATKTVIGSDLVQGLIQSLNPTVRKTLSRCSCSITFRFGNQGVLQSTQALVIPIHGFLLKVAIVPGSTPFLLRALEAVIDTSHQKLFARKINRSIPLQLTAKGLFLLDINDLAEPCHDGPLVETHVVSDAKEEDASTVAANDNYQESRDNTKGNRTRIRNNHQERELTEKDVLGDKSENQDGYTAKTICHDDSNLCPKSIVKGFVVPVKPSNHGQFVSATAEGSGDSRAANARPEPIQSAPNGLFPDRFWKGPLRSDLSGCLADGSALDQMVCGSFPKFEHHQAPSVSPLCEPSSGACRVGGQGGGIHPRDQGAQPEGHYHGQWEVIPEGTTKGQGQVSGGQGISGSNHGSPGMASRSGRLHAGATGVGSRVSRHSTPGVANVEHGECAVPSHLPSGEDHGQHGNQHPHRGQVREPQVESSTLLSAGDICEDVPNNVVESVERNREGKYFQHMIHKIESELQEVVSESSSHGSNRYHLFEVFCGPQSQLTHQAQQLGFRSARFGYAQCDLQTSTGRKMLLRELVSKRPENVWFSPSCGPWSKWSNLNGTKSIQAWDQLHEDRFRHVEQIALGVWE